MPEQTADETWVSNTVAVWDIYRLGDAHAAEMIGRYAHALLDARAANEALIARIEAAEARAATSEKAVADAWDAAHEAEMLQANAENARDRAEAWILDNYLIIDTEEYQANTCAECRQEIWHPNRRSTKTDYGKHAPGCYVAELEARHGD